MGDAPLLARAWRVTTGIGDLACNEQADREDGEDFAHIFSFELLLVLPALGANDSEVSAAKPNLSQIKCQGNYKTRNTDNKTSHLHSDFADCFP